MKIRIPALLLLLGLHHLPVAAETLHDHHLPPETVDYALILPANLPHLLRTANGQATRLGLDESQKQLVRELMAEAPLKVFSRLQQAEKLEKDLAQDILFKQQGVEAVQSRLDELCRLKRAASEAQIATINRIQSALSERQFGHLLKLAGAAGSH